MMRSGLLFAIGGDVLTKYGTLTRRYQVATRGGEDTKELVVRAGARLRIGSDGILYNCANNVPAVDHLIDPLTGLQQAYLRIEPAATNKIAATENLSTFTKIGATTPSTAILSPRNDATATFIREDGSAGGHSIQQSYTLGGISNTAGFIIFLQANGRTKGRVRIISSAGADPEFGASVDLVAGTSANSIGTNGVVTFQKLIGPLAGGWWALHAYGAPLGASATVNFAVILRDAGGNETYTGDGASGMNVWGCVATDAELAGFYWGAATSRVADVLSAPFFVQDGPIWFYKRFLERGTVILNSSAGPMLVGSALPFTRWDTFANPGYRFSHQTAAGAVVSTPAGVPTFHQVVEILGVILPNGSVQARQRINGAAETVGAQSGALAFAGAWSSPVINIGPSGFHGEISQLKVGRLLDDRGNQVITTVADAAAVPI